MESGVALTVRISAAACRRNSRGQGKGIADLTFPLPGTHKADQERHGDSKGFSDDSNPKDNSGRRG